MDIMTKLISITLSIFACLSLFAGLVMGFLRLAESDYLMGAYFILPGIFFAVLSEGVAIIIRKVYK